MDWKAVVSNAPYYLATSMEECPFDRFWVVQLNNGLEVFEDEPRSDLDKPNAWLRLRQLCEDHSVKIINMAFVDRLDPDKQVNLRPNADGYFYSKRARRLFNATNGMHYQDHGQGVGNLVGNTLVIYWRNHDGTTEVEHRPMTEVPAKHAGQLSLIKN